MGDISVIAGPVGDALDLTTEAKPHLRVDHSDEDALIRGLVAAAAKYFAKHTGRVLLTQTLRLTLDWFPTGENLFERAIKLPRTPVQEVVSIVYVDLEGDEQTLSADAYEVDLYSSPPRIAPIWGTVWPIAGKGLAAVTVTFKAGYGASAADVPEDAKVALKMLLGHWYRNREAVGAELFEQPLGIQALLTINWDGAYGDL